MWSSRLFWKLFLSSTGLILLATVCFVVIVSGWQAQQIKQQVLQRMHDTAVVMRSHVADDWEHGRSAGLQQLVERLGVETGSRITLVAPDGEVLADSDEDPAIMDNHKNREELLQAAFEGVGSSERVSPTLEVPMYYFAVRAEVGGETAGLVRVAVPMTTIHSQIAATNRLIWTVAGGISLLVLVLTYWVVARIIRPVATLTGAAESIATGEYRQTLAVTSRDELAALADAFNRMSGEMARRESELRQSSERLATVLRGMDEGVIAVDDRERILFANAAAARLFGFSSADCQGRPLLEIVRNHSLHQAVVATLAGSSDKIPNVEIDAPFNRVLAVHASQLPGTPCPGVVLVLHEITELRRLETMRQEFAANVSHELKTPLSSIKAYTETLRNGAIDDDKHNREFVLRIEEQAERLHLLIVDLLSLARIESGKESLEFEDIPLAEMISDALAHHRQAAEAGGITLIDDIQSPGVCVRADKVGLQQILDNLLDNAIKYTASGGTVTVRSRTAESMAVIEVVDTGIGIAPDQQARVFERFYRVDKARSRELGGTGLGLAIVKHLVQSLGGRVELASKPRRGSTFSVWLPQSN